MRRIAGGAAPRLAAVVREVAARITIGDGAAGEPGSKETIPGAGHVIVGACNDAVGVVGIDGDGSFILRRASVILVDDHHVRCAQDRIPVQRRRIRKREHVGPRREQGVGDVSPSSSSAANSIRAEKRTSDGAVARSDAAFPLSVVMSNFWVSALEVALAGRSADEHPTAAIASATVPMVTLMSLPTMSIVGKKRGGDPNE